jgi:alpha-L-fucosidase 2
MIYWPALATNRTSHLKPLWRMFREWLPRMQATGEKFFGQPGALMIPHAVDDRLQVVGSFWTGTIDHACTAWMAQLAWLDYRYSLDTNILREIAWPLLNGAFEGYWAMTETSTAADGKISFRLPVSVSPEFKGARMDAWGANASFQLAAYHMVAQCLQQASTVLDLPGDPRWQEVQDKLPLYAVFKGPRTLEYPESESSRIALWEGMDLVESHRHHSHLAGIFPFGVLDSRDTAHKNIISNSLWHLTHKGAGAWSGWCVPWAATLFARNINADAAVSWLHYFKDHYTNEGRGTLHNARHTGLSVIADRPWAKVTDRPNREIMQLDGGFGAMTAILELLVQNRRDGIHVLPDIPLGWDHFSFQKIGTEGAFQVSAWVKGGQVEKIKVKSLAGGPLKIWHYLGEDYLMDGLPRRGGFLEINCTKGQELVLTPSE